MLFVIGIISLIILIIIIYFKTPYSRLKSEFDEYLVKSEQNSIRNKKNSKYELENLPECIMKFYSYTGLINKVNCKHVNFDFVDADFVNIEMKKTLKIDYSEHIFADVPARFAFIDSSLFGIPFQGLDSFYDGKGGMKGVIAKNITLFNQRGEAMDKAALVTWLAEIIFMPAELLNGDIEIKEIDKNTVMLSITYNKLTVSGVLKFLENGQLVEFTTDDRAVAYNDGRIEYRKWTAQFEEYTNKDGLVLPNILKSKWHFDDEEIVYFDGSNLDYKFY